jgi:hypothetical protein
MAKRLFLLALFLAAQPCAAQSKPPLLPEETVAALAGELSGATAKNNLEFIARLHRTRGSRQFRMAVDHIAAQLRRYGLSDVKIEQFPADGRIWYGTQRSRPGWDADFAELWELRLEQNTAPCGGREERWVRAGRIASWEAEPITLAQDSESGEVTAELVDVGAGTADADYAGKDVRGKLVLVSAQPGAAADLAVGKYGAAGILSYAQNQPQAWLGDDADLVRWGHLETFAAVRTFAFMLSPKQAQSYRLRLAAGQKVMLQAKVLAGQRPSSYDIVSAAIPGADARLGTDEIVFTCHLDHPRPGANDNASGCVAILEVARALQKLIVEGRVPRPARSLRFLWPPEIEGSIVYLNARPELAARFKANIHMDMVGGGPQTKAVFHVTRGPASLPSFVNDVAEAFAEFANQQTYQFAATGRAAYPLVAATGGKEPLRAEIVSFTAGSDHQVFAEGSWRIPTIYFNDWPDRYIHTNKDTADKVDPTKLQRAAFIGAATGLSLASLREPDGRAVWNAIKTGILRRRPLHEARKLQVQPFEAELYTAWEKAYGQQLLKSLRPFLTLPADVQSDALEFLLAAGPPLPPPSRPLPREYNLLFERLPEPKGPMGGFGYDFFTDKLGRERVREVRLLRHQGLWGSGDYAYEVLNLVDGQRRAGAIWDAVAATYGPVPFDYVLEYLRALESIGLLREKKSP